MRERLERRASDLRAKLQRVDETYVLERTIDVHSYNDLRDRLREDLALTEFDISEARNEQLDVESVLAFAEQVIGNAATLWVNASMIVGAFSERCFQMALRGARMDLEPP